MMRKENKQKERKNISERKQKPKREALCWTSRPLDRAKMRRRAAPLLKAL